MSNKKIFIFFLILVMFISSGSNCKAAQISPPSINDRSDKTETNSNKSSDVNNSNQEVKKSISESNSEVSQSTSINDRSNKTDTNVSGHLNKNNLIQVYEKNDVLDQWTFTGLGDDTTAILKYSSSDSTKKIIFNKKSGQPHVYFSGEIYYSVKVFDSNKNQIFSKEVLGDDSRAFEGSCDLETNYKIVIYCAEPSRLIADPSTLKSNMKDLNQFVYLVSSDNNLKDISVSSYFEEEIDSLFVDSTMKKLSDKCTQPVIDNLKSEIEDADIEASDKEKLLSKLEIAQDLLDNLGAIVNNKLYTKNLFTLPSPKYVTVDSSGLGSYQDRQDLGIVLETGSRLMIRQANTDYQNSVYLRLLGNDRNKEKSISITDQWSTVDLESSLVPFVDTPTVNSQKTNPKIEFMVTKGTAKSLLKFDNNTDNTALLKNWRAEKQSFSLIQANHIQILVPILDLETMNQINIKSLINDYDNKLFSLYNALYGFSEHSKNLYDTPLKQRYFARADIHGAGAAYYSPNWIAMNSSSVSGFLSLGWVTLHEIGHGYELHSGKMATVDVWNNVYGTLYQEKYLDNFSKDCWVWGGHKEEAVNDLEKEIFVNKKSYNDLGYSNRLMLLLALVDGVGQDNFAKFNSYHRSLSNNGEKDKQDLVDLMIEFFSENMDINLIPYFDTIKIPIDDSTRLKICEQQSKPLVMLEQLVPENKINEAIQKLNYNTNLKNKMSLVSNDQLSKLDLKSKVTLRIGNVDLVKNSKLIIKDGKKIKKEVVINDSEIDLGTLSNGVYTLETDSKYVLFDKPYIYIKDSGEYSVDAVDACIINPVKMLFSDEKYDTLSANTSVDSIKRAREEVSRLKDEKQIKANIELIDKAQNILKQWTLIGLGDSTFGIIRYLGDGRLIFTKYSTKPHVYYSGQTYFKIKITDSQGKIIYCKDISGDNSEKCEDTIKISPEYNIELYHAEPSRLLVNDPKLKSPSQNVVYDVTDQYKVEIKSKEWALSVPSRVELNREAKTLYKGSIPLVFGNLKVQIVTSDGTDFSDVNKDRKFRIEPRVLGDQALINEKTGKETPYYVFLMKQGVIAPKEDVVDYENSGKFKSADILSKSEITNPKTFVYYQISLPKNDADKLAKDGEVLKSNISWTASESFIVN